MIDRVAIDWPLSYAHADGWSRIGTVVGVSHHQIEVDMPGLSLGACVAIDRRGAAPAIAEAISIDDRRATCLPLGDPRGIVAGATARSILTRVGAFAGPALLGWATDAWGRCVRSGAARIVSSDAPVAPGERAPVRRRLTTHVAAIDAFVTLGYGQRIALFAGAGVGKSTLLRRIVDGAEVDARVIALVGERGREAAESIERLASDRRRKSTTIVCATAESSPIERMAAARTATAHAEVLASEGRDVLLVVDSLTRVATAWRELAMASGEAPAHRGHPPSLAGVIARLLERAGSRGTGSITAIYAVLVDGDDFREPVTDTVRALLDGHVVLSRRLAEGGAFPAIDVLRSLSRLMPALADERHRRDAAEVRASIAALERAEDLFAIGAYRPGGDPHLDAAVSARAQIEALTFDETSHGSPEFGADPIGALSAIAHQLRASTCCDTNLPDSERVKGRRNAKARGPVKVPDGRRNGSATRYRTAHSTQEAPP